MAHMDALRTRNGWTLPMQSSQPSRLWRTKPELLRNSQSGKYRSNPNATNNELPPYSYARMKFTRDWPASAHSCESTLQPAADQRISGLFSKAKVIFFIAHYELRS